MQSCEILVRRVAEACDMPLAALAVVDRDGTSFRATSGFAREDETALLFSPVSETLQHGDVCVAHDGSGGFYAGVALRAQNGAALGALAVADRRERAISARQKQALRDFAGIASELVASERQAQMLTHAMDEALDFVLVTDSVPPSQGGPFIEYANSPFLAATGYSADELVGQPYSALMADENDPAAVQAVVDNLEHLRDNEKELLLRRKNGSAFWTEFASRPLSRPDGSPMHWVAVGRDITNRRQTHQQLAALVKAIDSVSQHIEIYTLEDALYVPAFQNAASDPDASVFVETVLNETSLRERLKRGEVVRLTRDGLVIRPLGENAETVICVRAQPRRFAAAS